MGYIESSLLSIDTFLEATTGKIYKLLPLRENKDPFFFEHLDSLRIELMGAIRSFPSLRDDFDFLRIVNTINYFLEYDISVDVCRREVFKMLSILNGKLNKGGDASG